MPAQSERLHFSERWLNAYERYRYRRHIHAFRLGLAIVFSTLLAKVFHLQHGEWIGMTVFVVLGMLQFQGAIYSKAVERMLGTAIGLGVGLAVLWLNQHYLQDGVFLLSDYRRRQRSGWLVCGWQKRLCRHACRFDHVYAHRRQQPPLARQWPDARHERFDWCRHRHCRRQTPAPALHAHVRFMLADNLTDCAKMIAEISNGKRMTRERLEQNMIKMRQINARMVKSRSHLAATSGESHISNNMMEAMQHAHRKIVNTTELLLTTAAKLRAPTLNESEIRLLDRHFNQLQRELRLTVRLIKGHYARRIRIDTSLNTELSKPAARLHYDWQGFLWLSTNMRNEIAALVILLQRSRNKWLDKKELQRLKNTCATTTSPNRKRPSEKGLSYFYPNPAAKQQKAV